MLCFQKHYWWKSTVDAWVIDPKNDTIPFKSCFSAAANRSMSISMFFFYSSSYVGILDMLKWGLNCIYIVTYCKGIMERQSRGDMDMYQQLLLKPG